ncbi:MAG: fibronectin type III domain-containing protein [Chthoniobacterales bacterium]|nr:fibronectin type III domain-containing protein [Chthoniobacterales bacterium]
MRPPFRSAPRCNALYAIVALCAASVGQVVANDVAANYANTAQWVSSSHRGTATAANWTLESSSGNGGLAGRYIGNSALGGADINTDGKCFALFAWPPGSNAYAGAVKRFYKPTLTVGDTITFKVAVNFRNGNKGFNLRNASGSNIWLFKVGQENSTSGYYVQNNSVMDNGQQFGGYDTNTVFTFTFTQRENTLDWTIQRSGGITATVSGTANIPSGTMADVRFYITNTDSTDPVNNLYFNDFTYSAAPGNAPLTLSERRMPGLEPSHTLRFYHASATSVTFRSDNDGWVTSYPLTKVGGVWQMDIRDANLTPGWHAFKFRPNSNYESGDNRWLYIREDGKICKPPAIFLTWYHDPTTTMAVQWHNYNPAHNKLRYRPVGGETWQEFTAQVTDLFPTTERLIHKAEITGLTPNTEYEFQLDGDAYEGRTNRFKTLPATLDQPLTFIDSGDCDVSSSAVQMASLVGALDPAFVILGGDLAYNDDYQPNFWKWYRFLDAAAKVVGPNGRLVPIILTLGNHEMKGGYHNSSSNPSYEPGEAWKNRVAAQYMPIFGIPGQESYRALDIGNYLSFILTDTDHLSPMAGAQTTWLQQALNERRHVPHLIPAGHLAAYPSNRDINDSRHAFIRQNWSPLYEQAGVQLVLDHHDHTFKRTPPILGSGIDPKGITYIGDGTWGVELRVPKDPASTWYLEKAESRRHIFAITIRPDGRTVRAIDSNGIIFDEFSQTIDGVPAPPANLNLETLATTFATFSWQPVANAHEYLVFRNGSQIAVTTSTVYADTGLEPETEVSYQVFARNRSGTSGASNTIDAVTPVPPPAPEVPQQVSTEGLGPNSIRITWDPVDHASEYLVYRNGDLVGTVTTNSFADSGLDPSSTYSYTVAARNITATSAASALVMGGTTQPTVPYELDGLPDSAGYLVSLPGMTFHAALRGTSLYLATWTPAGGGSDHMIFVTDQLLPSATTPAPWTKAGLTAAPSSAPYLAAESSSPYISWFNAPASALAFRAPDGGNKIEGVIDLVEAFGDVPSTIYIASAAFLTTDGGSLASQSPEGNGNGNIEPGEFLAIPVAALRDSLGTGTFDRLDPNRLFRAKGVHDPLDEGAFTLRWPAIPGHSYHLWRTPSLTSIDWQRITAEPIVAPSGSGELFFKDTNSPALPDAFYRVNTVWPE